MKKKLNILLVEDCEEITELAADVFASWGHNICTAENGMEAQKAINDERVKFDLIISDEDMPIMSGLRLLAKLREEGVEIPFLLHTSHAGMGDFDIKAIELGAHRVVKKLDTESIQAFISEVFGAAS